MSCNGHKVVLLGGDDLRDMFLQGTLYFEKHKEAINDLNVFPVPDGDTGTNMALTLQAASRELQSVSTTSSIGEVSRIAARSALMGARGNSGVILSQLFQGIARGLAGKEDARLTELGRAFQYGIVYAYNAVSRPVEGTILTVAREIARGSRIAVQKNINVVDLLGVAIASGKKALERTPDLLPVLKEAGVVDAGGLGLIVFLEGCLQSVSRHSSDEIPLTEGEKATGEFYKYISQDNETVEESTSLQEEFDTRFPYCTELIIRGDDLLLPTLRQQLEPMGDSLLVAGDTGVVKVHIHTANPGSVLETCLACGSIHDIKIDNMLDQFNKTRWSDGEGQPAQGLRTVSAQIETTPQQRKPLMEIGLVAVAAGTGFVDIFESMGADRIVFGGQSMNPPVEDLVNAVLEVNSKKVIILPNNSNVQFAAEQAVKLVDKEISVIDTNSLPQGLAAILAFDRSKSLADNFVEMCLRARQVKTLEVTYATRDAVVNGITVQKDDIIGLADGALLVSGLTINETVLELLRNVLDDQEEQIVTLFYGHDVTESDAGELAQKVEADFPDSEVELQSGGQPLYYYLISVE